MVVITLLAVVMHCHGETVKSRIQIKLDRTKLYALITTSLEGLDAVIDVCTPSCLQHFCQWLNTHKYYS
jgi:hypothetical protein